MKRYNHKEIELKWQENWLKKRVYQPDLLRAKKPYYNLMMFPYPSAEGLHVGNMYAFTGSDVWGRYMRMKGYEVFEPIGLDGFGIHSENYAINIGSHPVKQAKKSQSRFYEQLKRIGNGFAWENRLETYDPDYYQWTQWIFIQLFKHGLAYRGQAKVNWCLSCKTVLADEQVIKGKCERCSREVEKRQMEQWCFKITEYAERLLANLDKIDWDNKIKIAQREWIGKSQGIVISYAVVGTDTVIDCFTTRPDTNFGATFVVLGPEHPLLLKITKKPYLKRVKTYVELAGHKSEIERLAEGREKTGEFTGAYVVNQLNKRKLPVYVSDFVLGDVGTGAVVGVPGHDRRDFEFALAMKLPIVRVVKGSDNDMSTISRIEQVQEDEGVMVNSGFLNGMEIHQAIEKMMDHLEKKGWGKRVTAFHLRDWLISRQRYWGPPIPMVFCEACAKEGRSWFDNSKPQLKSQNFQTEENLDWAKGWYPVAEEELPVELPYLENFKPKGTGEAPLAQLTDWVKVKCPGCGAIARRETDVSDTFLDSAWYFLRYPNVGLQSSKLKVKNCNSSRSKIVESQGGKLTARFKIEKLPWDKEITKKWLPVAMYIGGAEHSVLHLLYARFLTMVLHDLGWLDFEEPFTRFRAHGLIIKDGAKMSKSKGNVVVPDDYIEKFGADTFRLYLMFLGPLRAGGDFRDAGVAGMYRFVRRMWETFREREKQGEQTSEKLKKQLHLAIRQVGERLMRLKYNTAISALMELVNIWREDGQVMSKQDGQVFCQLLAPLAPHLAEALYQELKGEKQFKRQNSVHLSHWPEYDQRLVGQEAVEMVIQVNGKMRATIRVPVGKEVSQEKMISLAKKDKNVGRFIKNKKIKQVVWVPGKLINLVVG